MNMPSDRPDHPDWGARADFPLNTGFFASAGGITETWERMCDEIDMLRRALAIAVLDRCRPVMEALEEYDRTGKMP